MAAITMKRSTTNLTNLTNPRSEPRAGLWVATTVHDLTDLFRAAGLDGSSIASRGSWRDTASLGVDSRSAPCLCRVVAGDGHPVWPPFSPRCGIGRPTESRSPASGRELAARRTIKPGGLRALASLLTGSGPFFRIAAI